MEKLKKLILSDIQVFIFDLDGTIVDSNLDFESMRRDLGIKSKKPILETIENDFTLTEQTKAMQIIREHELKGVQESKLMPGFNEFQAFLKEKNIPMAIQTRNSTEITSLTLAKFNIDIPFFLTRDNCPPKPNPEGINRIMKRFNTTPNETVYIGDSHYDMQTAKNAHIFKILFRSSYNKDFTAQPDLEISNYKKLIYEKN